MRWARVYADGKRQLALVVGDDVRCLGSMDRDRALPEPVWRAIGEGDLVTWIAADAEADGALGLWLEDRQNRIPTRPSSSVRLLAPIAHPPKNIICVGRNYIEHAVEAARFRGQRREAPAHPVFFTKPWTAICGPGDAICCDRTVTSQLDYEGEVAVIIGHGGKDIASDMAYRHIFGFSLLNDVTARDLQALHGQYYKGKGLDTFAPFGPHVVTIDEIPVPADLVIETRVNGELRQRAKLGELIFSISEIISVLSASMTLEPGDIISTGTPAGVGMSFTPPKFLANRDIVEVKSPSIGVLSNQVQMVDGILHRQISAVDIARHYGKP